MSDDEFGIYPGTTPTIAPISRPTSSRPTTARSSGAGTHLATPRRTAASGSSPICSSRRRRRAVSDGRLLSALGRRVPPVVRAVGDELPRVYREGRTRAAVPDVQGHLRTPSGTSAGWPKRPARPHDPADEGSAAIGGLRRNAIRPRSRAARVLRREPRRAALEPLRWRWSAASPPRCSGRAGSGAVRPSRRSTRSTSRRACERRCSC